MKEDRSDHETYRHWKVTILTWIAAIALPLTYRKSETQSIPWISIGFGLLLLLSVCEGIRSKLRGSNTEFIARAIVPVVILLLSSLWFFSDKLVA